MNDERVGERRDRAEPRAEIRNDLGDGDDDTEEQRVLLCVRQQTERRQHPETEPGARADDQREQRLPSNVRRERVLHAAQQCVFARSRRIAPVDRAAETLHVEQHVDRDDDQQHQGKQRLADRDRRALDERDDLVRVLADVALLDLADELVAALLDVHRLKVMRVRARAGGGRRRGRRTSVRRRREHS